MSKTFLSAACALLFTLGVSLSAQASWYLDGESSRLSFITTFDFKHFPEAQITAQINLQLINELAPGAQVELRLPVTVTLRDKQHTYEAELLATRLDEHRFQVVTLEPLMLQAEDFGLQPELETLRKGAGLSAISFSVPVNAVLIFTAR